MAQVEGVTLNATPQQIKAMNTYYNAQPALPAPIAQMAQQAPNPTPVGQLQAHIENQGGTPTVVIPPQAPPVRQTQSSGGGLLGKLVKPVADTFHGVAQLAGVEPPHTVMRGGAYQRAQQGARLGYAASGLQDMLAALTHPSFGNAARAAIALPMIPGASMELGAGRALARGVMESENAALAANRTMLAKQLIEKGVAPEQAMRRAMEETGIAHKVVLTGPGGLGPKGNIGSITYRTTPSQLKLDTMKTARELTGVTDMRNAIQLLGPIVHEAITNDLTITGKIAREHFGGKAVTPAQFERQIRLVAKRLGYDPAALKLRVGP